MTLNTHYTAEVMVWGAEYSASDYGPQAKALFKGLDVGHSALKLTFPISENEALIEKMLEKYPGLEKLITKDEVNGNYEFYWSFWPGEEEGQKHILASLKEDIYWQRFGVPATYDTSKTDEFSKQADVRNARGLLGQRKRYKLEPEMKTHFPHGFEFKNAPQIPQTFLQKTTTSPTLMADFISIQKTLDDKLKRYEELQKQILNLQKEPGLSNDEKNRKMKELKKEMNQALGDVLYIHNIMHNYARQVNNDNFKLKRDPKSKFNKKTRQQIETNNIIIDESKKLVARLESQIPREISAHVVHGLLPKTVVMPLVKEAKDDKPGIHLESVLEASGKLMQENIQYQKLGKWNCSSTTAHILHESITDPKAKAQFKPNSLLPSTPQQVFNRSVTSQKQTQDAAIKPRMKESTLDGERSKCFIEMVQALCRNLRLGKRKDPLIQSKEQKQGGVSSPQREATLTKEDRRKSRKSL